MSDHPITELQVSGARTRSQSRHKSRNISCKLATNRNHPKCSTNMAIGIRDWEIRHRSREASRTQTQSINSQAPQSSHTWGCRATSRNLESPSNREILPLAKRNANTSKSSSISQSKPLVEVLTDWFISARTWMRTMQTSLCFESTTEPI